jgi:uncharacterized LabA/DUF88 family protein
MSSATQPRAVAFFDAQNLFHAAKRAFGHTWPNYDPYALASMICAQNGWRLEQVRHYTGYPSKEDDGFWHAFWTNKQAAMGTRGVFTFGRLLKYRSLAMEWPDRSPILLLDGTPYVRKVAQEKGIDIRIALDIVHLALEQCYDVAILFTQDQDLSEAVDEVKTIAAMQKRWVTVVCAFPDNPKIDHNHRGVNRTDWKRISQVDYATCLDSTDYRPKEPTGSPTTTP